MIAIIWFVGLLIGVFAFLMLVGILTLEKDEFHPEAVRLLRNSSILYLLLFASVTILKITLF